MLNVKRMVYLAHKSLQTAARIAIGTTLLEKHARKDLQEGCTFSRRSRVSNIYLDWILMGVLKVWSREKKHFRKLHPWCLGAKTWFDDSLGTLALSVGTF